VFALDQRLTGAPKQSGMEPKSRAKAKVTKKEKPAADTEEQRKMSRLASVSVFTINSCTMCTYYQGLLTKSYHCKYQARIEI
jgi:hypothetical protein